MNVETFLLRITPSYGLLIGILANLYGYFGTGYMFERLSRSYKLNCRKNWWHSLLYINNLVWYEKKNGEAMVSLQNRASLLGKIYCLLYKF
jgi:hypothetical protein